MAQRARFGPSSPSSSSSSTSRLLLLALLALWALVNCTVQGALHGRGHSGHSGGLSRSLSSSPMSLSSSHPAVATAAVLVADASASAPVPAPVLPQSQLQMEPRLRAAYVLRRAWQAGCRSGFSGGLATAIQVITMMWLRTTVNYQCKYDLGILEALHQLYRQGGIMRFYEGITFALVQGPLARFGAVAANEASLELVRLLARMDDQRALMVATTLGSLLASGWRLLLMPIDTCKTVLQVEGQAGFHALVARVARGDVLALYKGSTATLLSTLMGHYPWFYVHNLLVRLWPEPKPALGPNPRSRRLARLMRHAAIGFISSAASDVVANAMRVIKTVKQASLAGTELSYVEVVAKVYAEGGLLAFLGRGLLLRLLSNGLQSIVFTIVWKLLMAHFNRIPAKKPDAQKV